MRSVCLSVFLCWSVITKETAEPICVSLCWPVVGLVETAEPIEISFGRTDLGPKEPCERWGYVPPGKGRCNFGEGGVVLSLL